MLIPGNHDEALRGYVDTVFGRYRAGRRACTSKPRMAAASCSSMVTSRSGDASPPLGGAVGDGLRLAGALQRAARGAATPGRPGYWSLAGYANAR